MFTRDKLEACVAIINKILTAAIEPGDGKLQIIWALMTPLSSPAYCPTYLILYDGPE